MGCSWLERGKFLLKHSLMTAKVLIEIQITLFGKMYESQEIKQS